MTTPSASSKTPIASAPPPPPLSSESSSEWRKRKVHTDDGCQVFQVQVVEQPSGKTFFGSCEGYCHQLNMPHYRGVREVRVCV